VLQELIDLHPVPPFQDFWTIFPTLRLTRSSRDRQSQEPPEPA
jgi:hypothetical protein